MTNFPRSSRNSLNRNYFPPGGCGFNDKVKRLPLTRLFFHIHPPDRQYRPGISLNRFFADEGGKAPGSALKILERVKILERLRKDVSETKETFGFRRFPPRNLKSRTAPEGRKNRPADGGSGFSFLFALKQLKRAKKRLNI
jgi:hypothetical protein